MKESKNDIPMGSIPIIIGFNGVATRAVLADEVVSEWLDSLHIKDIEKREKYRKMVYNISETTTLDVYQSMGMIERIINLEFQEIIHPLTAIGPEQLYTPIPKEIVSVNFDNIPDVKSFGVKARSNNKRKRR